MKYKIKVDVMRNSRSRYYPLVKKHWWCFWENIANMTHILGAIAEKTQKDV